MLGRFKIYMRQKRPAHDPLPDGVRLRAQYRDKHCTSPSEDMVTKYLDSPSEKAWLDYEQKYLEILEARFRENHQPFEELAELSRKQDVYLGCTCPTKKNPNVWHCHTVLALKFMKEKYPDLVVVFPAS